MEPTAYLRRAALAFAILALAIGLAVALGGHGLHHYLSTHFDLTPAGATGVAAGFLAFGVFPASLAVSWALYRDISFGLVARQAEIRRQTQALDAAAAEAAAELEGVRQYNDVLREQLRSVTEQSEQAALQIAERLQANDAAFDRLDTVLAGIAQRTDCPAVNNPPKQHGQLLAALQREARGRGNESLADQIGELQRTYEQMLSRDETLFLSVQAARDEITCLFSETLASMQFQDVARQQIEHVTAALHTLDDHAQSLAQGLRSAKDAALRIKPLSQSLEAIYSTYVMDQQRRNHERAGAPGVAGDTGGGSKVELF